MIAPQPNVEVSKLAATIACSHCGGELVADARVCPRCGKESRLSVVERPHMGISGSQLLTFWRNASARTLASGLALVAGGACIVAAAVTSIVFKATNLVDWQAVQLWRIEWLLAAIAMLLAGILLKKK